QRISFAGHYPSPFPGAVGRLQYGLSFASPVAALLLFGCPRYRDGMLWSNSRGRPSNAPAAFIHPCQPTVAKDPPSGPGWAHELKHDGSVADSHRRWSGAGVALRPVGPIHRRIVEEAARIKGSAVMDAEVVCLVKKGVVDFDMLHGRTAAHLAVAGAVDLLMHDGNDLRRRPISRAQVGP